jgi:tetratricopeptide (TPR) repeat protein
MKSLWRTVWLTTILLVCAPATALADQTDQRLDELFHTLQTSHDSAQLSETEASIWEIWYDSGDEEVDTLMLEASALAAAGELGAAEDLYAHIIQLAPNFSEGWNRRATIRFYMQDYDGSMDDIEQTLKLEPRHFGALWGLGMILGLQQDYQRAIYAFEKLLEIKPNAQDARPRIKLLKEALAKQAV